SRAVESSAAECSPVESTTIEKKEGSGAEAIPPKRLGFHSQPPLTKGMGPRPCLALCARRAALGATRSRKRPECRPPRWGSTQKDEQQSIMKVNGEAS